MEFWKSILEDMVANCRFCKSTLDKIFLDLGVSPLANSFRNIQQINQIENFYPLRAFVCQNCFLVQLEEFEKPENIFSNYVYFSSYSKTWLKHIEDYANSAISRFGLKQDSQVIEIASNDGYLLQYFKEKGIKILGIEPAVNVSQVAQEKGIPTVNKFFGTDTANELVNSGTHADLLIAINVLPHTPNLIDFVQGLKILLNPNGIMMIQFSAYLLPLIQMNEFDMIYHEHFSYFSLLSIQKIFSSYGLEVFDVEEIPIHGGSLRLYVKHSENNNILINPNVTKQIKKEMEFGLNDISAYENFSEQIKDVKCRIWEFFINAKKSNKSVVCYGAPAKANTMLNFCGVGKDFIDYTVDINPHKQGLYLPGTHIPIRSPDKISETKPDYVLILPWNLKEEIMKDMKHIRDWGGKFVVLIPRVEMY